MMDMFSQKKITDIYEFGQKLGYLPYITERFIKLIGEEETAKLYRFNETELPKTIRFNTLRSSYANTESLLIQKGVELREIKNLPEAREIISSPVPIGATPEYLNGFYMLQGKNSLYPSNVLNPQPKDIVGDFASAPGGKTSHLSQLMNNKGSIIAIEVSENRCRSLKSNLSRLGVENTLVVNMDARDIASLNLQFDKILLDAPCSGSGIIITDRTRKRSKTLKDILNFHELQVSLLLTAIDVLKPEGEIVYCTCSLEPEENEYVISKVMEKKNILIETIDLDGDPGLRKFENYTFNPEISKAKRLYPQKTSGEGFFIIKMVKENE